MGFNRKQIFDVTPSVEKFETTLVTTSPLYASLSELCDSVRYRTILVNFLQEQRLVVVWLIADWMPEIIQCPLRSLYIIEWNIAKRRCIVIGSEVFLTVFSIGQ